MTATVWKYELRPPLAGGPVVLDMPAEAKILRVATQQYGEVYPDGTDTREEQPCLWAEVTPGRPPDRRSFLIVGTGHDIIHPEGFPSRRYVGSFSLAGPLEFHVYELGDDT